MPAATPPDAHLCLVHPLGDVAALGLLDTALALRDDLRPRDLVAELRRAGEAAFVARLAHLVVHLVAGVEHAGPAVEIVHLAGRFESNANDLDHIRRG